MIKTYLILDCNYLCYRALYTTGGLSYKGQATGAVYGFLKDIEVFQKMFDTDNIIFCWDFGMGLREQQYPFYKAKRRAARKELTKQEQANMIEFAKQIKNLRRKYLKWIGFKNIFYKKGYESDDIIASVCETITDQNDEAIIISADKDLYQLITPTISFYNPQKHKRMTLQGFKKEYDINPKLWWSVKALAGCNTDNVPGIKGVGEKTAIKYIRGVCTPKIESKFTSKKAIKIYHRNVKLIRLPYMGTPSFTIIKDKLSKDGWQKAAKRLGMKSLANKFPFGRGRR